MSVFLNESPKRYPHLSLKDDCYIITLRLFQQKLSGHRAGGLF
ncbi:hypothetical protein SPAB_02096 [Salmonella enterica subsp. enterica serovar Paratyphi B str. SPB7]|uniref:Uncharacterized protein n=1 Tax=Salmonella paratyphi B (strain ATCC BAA-1250 / SPB7) TaxID=1016998 RepID=A0A6C6Z2T5_SALPB|nr:hypothetical protein SPAB_02096 [Salmonella enterica subsp. enterica serovar Paratyphi B str. SPB7]